MNFLRDLAHAGKIAQGLFVAQEVVALARQVMWGRLPTCQKREFCRGPAAGGNLLQKCEIMTSCGR